VSRPAAPLSFALLGPLEVRRDGARIDPDTPKLRALLVALLVDRGVPRSTDRLIDDLWGDTPPTTAVGILQNYISQLRKLLGSDVLRRNGTGYVIDVSPDQVDVDRFGALLESARTAQSADATAARVRDALALWHGAPLAVDGPAAAMVLLRMGTGVEDTTIVRFREVRVAG